MSDFQLKRGIAATVLAHAAKSGEPIFDTETNSLFVGDGTTLGGLAIADTTDSVLDQAALFALTTTKQGDVYILDDTQKVYKRTSRATGVAVTLAADWIQIGDINTATVTQFYAEPTATTTPGAIGDGTAATLAITVNGMDWAGHPQGHVDTSGLGTNLRIETSDIVAFLDGSGVSFDYIGPKPVSLGADGTATDFHSAVDGDFQIQAMVQTYDDTTDGFITEATLIAGNYKKGDVRILTVDEATSVAGTYKADKAGTGAGILADWILISALGSAADTTTDVTGITENAGELLGLPYKIGDVRVLSDTVGTTLAGTYKCVRSEDTAAASLLTDWHLIANADHGTLV